MFHKICATSHGIAEDSVLCSTSPHTRASTRGLSFFSTRHSYARYTIYVLHVWFNESLNTRALMVYIIVLTTFHAVCAITSATLHLIPTVVASQSSLLYDGSMISISPSSRSIMAISWLYPDAGVQKIGHRIQFSLTMSTNVWVLLECLSSEKVTPCQHLQ